MCLRVHDTCATCVHKCPSVRVMGSLRVSDEPQDREELGPWRVTANACAMLVPGPGMDVGLAHVPC